MRPPVVEKYLPKAETTRADMVRLGIRTGLIVLAAGVVLHFALTRDLEMHKVQQRVDRAQKYLVLAHDALEHWIRDKGSAMQADGAALPEKEFVDWFATRQGGADYWRQEGVVARKDMYGPSGAFKDPLLYMADGRRWILVSRGPDGDFDIPADILAGDGDPGDRLAAATWDPTNGAAGGGDLWTGSFGAEASTK